MVEHVTQDKLAYKRQQHDKYASLWQYRAGTVTGKSGANQRSKHIKARSGLRRCRDTSGHQKLGIPSLAGRQEQISGKART